MNFKDLDSLDQIDSTARERYCPVEKFFGGVERSVIKCQKCNNTIIKNEEFYSLGLPVPEQEYFYFSVTFYPSKEESMFQPLVQYSIRIKKDAQLNEYIAAFCKLMGKEPDMVLFFEVNKSEFRRALHYSSSDHKTIADMYIHEIDQIFVYEKKPPVNIDRRKMQRERKKNFPQDLKPGDPIDVLEYREWLVVSFVSYDDKDQIVRYKSQNFEQTIDVGMVAPFLSKTGFKQLAVVKVLNRRLNTTRDEMQCFLKPFILSIPEWVNWEKAVEMINEEAFRFVDESYWQKVSSNEHTTPTGESSLKRNESDKNLTRQKSQSLHVNMTSSTLKPCPDEPLLT